MLGANSRNAARAFPHPEVSARAWRGFPGNASRETWAQRRRKGLAILHRTSGVRLSRCAPAPATRIAALLNTRVAIAPSRPLALKSSPAGRVIALPPARSHRAVSFPPTVSSTPAAHNKRRRNPDHVAPSRAPVSRKLLRSYCRLSASLVSLRDKPHPW